MVQSINYARVNAMRNCADLLRKIDGNVAELGVYQGDFAEEIGKYFLGGDTLLSV